MIRELIFKQEKNKIQERCIPGESPEDIIQQHLALYNFVLPWAKNKIVLDVASGVGYGSYQLAVKGKAKKVIGIDISSQAIDQANKDYQAFNLSFRIGDAEKKIDLADNYFDLVISIETIEHLKGRDRFLQEVIRVLKPAGVFILSTPNKAATLRSQLPGKPLNKYHIVEFRKRRLEKLLGKYFNSLDWFGQKVIPQKSILYFFKRIGWILKGISPVREKIDYKVLPYPQDNAKDVAIFVVIGRRPKNNY
ncbi:class I SAM-dependent methyltransferase [Patescibacteria group bacterium]|nr:class I SAM-dependent methyltransferase [Patescibacteria group bacterium]